MEKVIISQNVADDFKNADFYKKQISWSEARWLLDGYLDRFYEFALKRGWTKEKSVSDYVKKEHGAIYTAAFLITNRL